MLEKLNCLHEQIASQIAALEILTRKALAPVEDLTAVRYKLTRASRARTTLLETEIYPILLHYCQSGAEEAIEELQAEGKAQMLTSARHISTWNVRQIESRWHDYRAASAAMREVMQARLSKEKRLLYPLIEQGMRAAISPRLVGRALPSC